MPHKAIGAFLIVSKEENKRLHRKISIAQCQKLHPEQWVKIYGLFSNRCEYINTCQVDQLEVVIPQNYHGWFHEIVLEPVDESEQPMLLEEAMNKNN